MASQRFIKLLSSQLFISLALLIILIVFLTPMIKNYRQRQAVDQEIANLEQEIAEAQSQNNEFRKMIDYLESDQFVEEQARLNFGLKKTGEQVVVVQSQEPVTAAAEMIPRDQPLINEQAQRLFGNFLKWLDYFFDPGRKK